MSVFPACTLLPVCQKYNIGKGQECWNVDWIE
jgi:hypothetical protein